MSSGVLLDGATVLVVDDNADNRFFLSRWLAEEGALVVEATDGAQGIELARRLPDLVICDVRLPDMSGLDVTATLKADPVTSEIPVIQRSSVDIDEPARVSGLSSGADSYLVEPIDRRLLIATATALLRFREVTRQLESALSIDVTGVFDWSVNAGIVRWSESLERIHGMERGSFGGTFDDFVATVHPADTARIGAQLAEALQHADSFEVAYRFMRADGSHGWMEGRASIFRDAEGRATRALGLAHDVTDRMIERARLDQLRRLAADLNGARTVDEVLEVVAREVEPAGIRIVLGGVDGMTDDDVVFSSLIDEQRFDLVGSSTDSSLTERQLAAIGALAGGALDRATRYEHERDNALALQRALLPTSAPTIEGWRLDAEYLPASAFDRVGGDFYDVVVLEGAFVVVLGDVAGHGLDATKQMGTVRTMLRTLACMYDGDPSSMLRHAAALFDGVCGRDGGFVTVVVARFGDDGSVAVASAGHPPPILCDAVGDRPRLVAVAPTPPLGVVGLLDPVVAEFHLAEGSWMVFYTDGVFEGRSRPVDESALDATLEISAHPTADEVVALGEKIADLNHDDRAVVVVERCVSGA